jgi:hypothetical protein
MLRSEAEALAFEELDDAQIKAAEQLADLLSDAWAAIGQERPEELADWPLRPPLGLFGRRTNRVILFPASEGQARQPFCSP